MITPLSPEAAEQIANLVKHYRRKKYRGALVNLSRAIRDAQVKTAQKPDGGLTAPRPYPQLAKPGRLWLKEQSYWIAYRTEPLVIIGVFYETNDIPRRVGQSEVLSP